MFYDLHTHTTNSDGDLTGLALLKKANDLGLEYLCITDHDYITKRKIDKEYELETGNKSKTILLSGIEFSIEDRKNMHILGYGIKDIELVQSYLREIQIQNLNICKRLLEHIKKDYQIDLDLEKHKHCKMNKGLIRKMLVEGGYASNLDEAGNLYTGKKSKYYEKTMDYPLEETINIIIKSGGIPVLAHPSTLHLSDEDLDCFVSDLKEMGIIGIEIFNTSKTSTEQTIYYENLAKRYDLLTTCGSDFHNDKTILGIKNDKSKKLIKKIME